MPVCRILVATLRGVASVGVHSLSRLHYRVLTSLCEQPARATWACAVCAHLPRQGGSAARLFPVSVHLTEYGGGRAFVTVGGRAGPLFLTA